MGDISDLIYYFGIISNRYAEEKLKGREPCTFLVHKDVSEELVLHYLDKEKHIKMVPIILRPDSKTSEDIYRDVTKTVADKIDAKIIKNFVQKPSWIISAEDLQVEAKGLGAGNFSSVRAGTYRGQKAAIKILKEGNMTFDDLCFEIIKEVTAMEIVSKNSYCIKMFGVVTEKKPMMIVMELMLSPLLLVLKENKEIAKSELLLYCLQLLQALSFLEEKKLVHRDIAARNCLFNRYGILKLTDFGLAGYANSFVAYNSQGDHVPVRWRAPETVKEQCSTYTVKSDVWSFAVTVLEIYDEGKWPREDVAPADFRDLLRKEPGKIFKPHGREQEELQVFMRRCWEIEPEQRPSFAEMRDSIKQLLKNKYVLPELEDMETAKIPNVKQLSMAEYEIIAEFDLDTEEAENQLLEDVHAAKSTSCMRSAY